MCSVTFYCYKTVKLVCISLPDSKDKLSFFHFEYIVHSLVPCRIPNIQPLKQKQKKKNAEKKRYSCAKGSNETSKWNTVNQIYNYN